MARLPYQVLVIPYRFTESIEYCVFKRKDSEMRQWISGGGEDDETSYESACRELFEESRVVSDDLIRLESLTYIRSDWFSEIVENYPEVVVVPEYSFGVEVNGDITLSDEHDDFEWVSYDDAMDLLHWDSNKTALYELNSYISKKAT